MIPNFNDEQKSTLLWLASMSLPEFDTISREDTHDERKSYFDKGLTILKMDRQQLCEIMPAARKAYINGMFAAKQELGNGHKADAAPLVPWQQTFRTVEQLEAGPLQMLVERFMPYGITGIGSLSGVAKTWFCLALSKALTTGKPFLSVYPVPEKRNVLYLIPEMGDRAFRNRCEKMGLPMSASCDPFFRCMTVNDGRLGLRDPRLETCIRETKPVVFFDTLVRFNPGDDENSAQQNTKLVANAFFDYQTWGSPGIVFAHHSPKYASAAENMDLENVFRGSGDLGAMCDAAYGLGTDKRKKEDGKAWDNDYFEQSKSLTRVLVKCVKPRDFEAPEAFLIQGRPHIDERGDFAVVDSTDRRPVEEGVIEDIRFNLAVLPFTLKKKYGIGDAKLKRIAKSIGREWKDKYWVEIKDKKVETTASTETSGSSQPVKPF